MTNLNNEQLRVAQAITSMQGSDRLVVSGRAGSGKTYAVTKAVANRKALFLAPTHPAKAVLERELAGTSHKVMTIHSAIGWYKFKDQNLEDIEGYMPAHVALSRMASGEDKSGIFGDVDIIIVDEFSMVNEFLFDGIEDYATEFNLPVVYSGDRFQLPPVQGCEVIAEQGFDTITLNQSIRFSEDSDIFRFGELLRDSIENRPNEELPCLFGGSGVQVVAGNMWMRDLTNGYANGGDLLAVTSDNTTLRRLRKKVRQVDHDKLCAGDVVMSKQTDDKFRNGEQLTVCHVERHTRVLPDVPGCVSRTRSLTVLGDTLHFAETDKTAFILDKEKDAGKLSSRMMRLHQKGKLSYDDAHRILVWIDEINRFELAVLATVHKSQGRSIDTIYIDTGSVLRKPHWLSPVNHLRLLYTAVTRPRKNAVFYQMPTYCEVTAPDHLIAA